VAIPSEEAPPRFSYPPSLRIQGEPGSHYSLSIRLPSWWWNKVKGKEFLKQVLTLKDPAGGGEHIQALDDGHTADVQLALIGSQEFEATFLLQHCAVTPGFPKSVVEKALKWREETRTRLGWTPSDDGKTVEHRYLNVWYSLL
jgi:hypothetical protein